MRARSVIPGRQRWDVGTVLLRRPRAAQLLESELKETPGVGVVHANPVTGRLLIQHDTALSSAEVDQLVRKAVLALRQASTLTRSPRPASSVVMARVGYRYLAAPSVALAGGATFTLAVAHGTWFLLRSSVVLLGAILPAAVVIALLTGRKSRCSHPPCTASTGAPQDHEEVSRHTIASGTGRELAAWQSRPLDPVYPVIFIGRMNVKIRAGTVANLPLYLALAVTVDGHRDILGLWLGEHGDRENAQRWLRVLTEIKHRGTQDCCILVCDDLTGLSESIKQIWPYTIAQTCIVHLLRNSFRYASKKDLSAIAHDLKLVYTAASEQTALENFVQFRQTWETKYPAIIQLWTNAWAEFVPFLAFRENIRTIICTTNTVVSINSRIRRTVNTDSHFPTGQAALECVYVAIMNLNLTGKDRQRWSTRWKTALTTFEITFGERLPGRT